MANLKQLLRDWENEKIKLNNSIFLSKRELAQFIIYAFNSLVEGDFEILIEDLNNI